MAPASLQAQEFVTVEEVERRLSWTPGRTIDALETLLEVRSLTNFIFSAPFLFHNFLKY